ncbi:MAG: type II toxin-antitoxin system HicA family toxin [Planctomycetia bacterium]|nr:type II toxin-antitoxin system HicA family toxin [Planctomycetia bacterium]
MAKLPRLSGKEMVRFLERQGFTVLRVRGSHHYLARGEQHVAVPVHGNHEIKIGTLRSILRDLGMTPTEFAELYLGRRGP